MIQWEYGYLSTAFPCQCQNPRRTVGGKIVDIWEPSRLPICLKIILCRNITDIERWTTPVGDALFPTQATFAHFDRRIAPWFLIRCSSLLPSSSLCNLNPAAEVPSTLSPAILETSLPGFFQSANLDHHLIKPFRASFTRAPFEEVLGHSFPGSWRRQIGNHRLWSLTARIVLRMQQLQWHISRMKVVTISSSNATVSGSGSARKDEWD